MSEVPLWWLGCVPAAADRDGRETELVAGEWRSGEEDLRQDHLVCPLHPSELHLGLSLGFRIEGVAFMTLFRDLRVWGVGFTKILRGSESE